MKHFKEFLKENVVTNDDATQAVKDAFNKSFPKSFVWTNGMADFLNVKPFLVVPEKTANDKPMSFDPLEVSFKIDFTKNSVVFKNKSIYTNPEENANKVYSQAKLPLRGFKFKDLNDLSKKLDDVFKKTYSAVKKEFDADNMTVFDEKFDIKSKL